MTTPTAPENTTTDISGKPIELPFKLPPHPKVPLVIGQILELTCPIPFERPDPTKFSCDWDNAKLDKGETAYMPLGARSLAETREAGVKFNAGHRFLVIDRTHAIHRTDVWAHIQHDEGLKQEDWDVTVFFHGLKFMAIGNHLNPADCAEHNGNVFMVCTMLKDEKTLVPRGFKVVAQDGMAESLAE